MVVMYQIPLNNSALYLVMKLVNAISLPFSVLLRVRVGFEPRTWQNKQHILYKIAFYGIFI
jgi:hypothetical protein